MSTLPKKMAVYAIATLPAMPTVVHEFHSAGHKPEAVMLSGHGSQDDEPAHRLRLQQVVAFYAMSQTSTPPTSGVFFYSG